MKTILFQGDSITDCGRNREMITSTGVGYPLLVKAQLGFENPGEYTFINKGISGNRIVDLYARIKADLINLKPDVLSILIGINDVWHEIGHGNGVSVEKYERVYDWLLTEVKEALPEVRILILEPFVLQGHATEATEEKPERWEFFRTQTPLYAAAAKRLAEKHGTTFVPLQHLFDEACKLAEPAYWLHDGVHPTAMGHELIAREWMKAFRQE
jgi:lysophospholipase L1-like esterase